MQFRTFVVRDGRRGTPLGFRLCDTMGMEESQGIGAVDLEYVLAGNVPDGYQVDVCVCVCVGGGG